MRSKPEDVAAVEGDSCPFCGAEKSDGSYNVGAVRAWKCDTNYAIRTDYGEPFGSITPIKKEYLFRDYKCYEAQLAAQAVLLAECREVIPGLLQIIKNCVPYAVLASGQGIQYHTGESEFADEMKDRATALLPRLEKFKGEK